MADVGVIDATVERLAAGHPDAMLPCPWCGALAKGGNLARHVAKVHPSQVGRPVPHAWRGPDRLIARPLVLVPLAATIAMVAWAIASNPDAGGAPDDRLVLGSAGALSAGIIVAVLVLWEVPLFRARLRVLDDGLLLRHTLGLRQRRLPRIDSVELGTAIVIVGGDGDPTTYDAVPAHPERAGTYLRVRGGRRTITVRCKQGSTARRSWTGWQQGRRRRRWDTTLRPGDFAALQYALAELGPLVPRG